MSQRDDELIQLLRAELTRRDTTTPREGFDMRVYNTVRGLERPRHRGLQRVFGAGAAVAAVAVVTVALVLGLRAHQSRGVIPPAAQPSATPVYGLLKVGTSATDKSVRFVRRDGTLVREVRLPSANLDPAEVLSAGGSQVFYTLEQHLYSVGVDGVTHDHGAVHQGTLPSELVVSPDGRRWAWIETDLAGDATKAQTVHDRLFVAGDGQPAHVVYTSSHQLQPYQGQTVDTAAVWTERGIVVVRQPVGTGGFIPFKFGTDARLVDADTGTVQLLAGCDNFDDLAADGSYVCASGGPAAGNDGIVTVFDPHGAVLRKVTVGAPVVGAGDALFSPDRGRVAIQVLGGDCSSDCNWRTDVVDIASGRVAQARPFGDLVTDWLADGTMVMSDPAGQGGLVLVAPDGHTTTLGPDGWIGVVHR